MGMIRRLRPHVTPRLKQALLPLQRGKVPNLSDLGLRIERRHRLGRLNLAARGIEHSPARSGTPCAGSIHHRARGVFDDASNAVMPDACGDDPHFVGSTGIT
jgi:hypothetical protein